MGGTKKTTTKSVQSPTTKGDLLELKSELKENILNLENKINKRFETVDAEINSMRNEMHTNFEKLFCKIEDLKQENTQGGHVAKDQYDQLEQHGKIISVHTKDIANIKLRLKVA